MPTDDFLEGTYGPGAHLLDDDELRKVAFWQERVQDPDPSIAQRAREMVAETEAIRHHRLYGIDPDDTTDYFASNR